MKILWTDGSASPNPGPGGYAVIEVSGDDAEPVALGCEKDTTNIRMEGAAMIAAIKYADSEPCEIHSDSEFWINVLTKWAPGWAENEWHKDNERRFNSEGKFIGWKATKIKNLDLVKELYELYQDNEVKLVWEKGHAGIDYNELADTWANKARLGVTL